MRQEAIGAVVITALLTASHAGSATARAGEPAPATALTVLAVRPDLQLERLIGLFDGAKAPHPAAALAAWRRATGNPDVLAKGAQAAIAALNPEMIPELRLLDRAVFRLGFDGDGRTRWHLILPHDDGTFAAVATAMVLSGGGEEEPLDRTPVDRLGPPGAPLMARVEGMLVVAGTRDDLRSALDRALDPPPAPDAVTSGWLLRVDPEGLSRSGQLGWRRLGEGLRAAGCRRLDLVATLAGDHLSIRLNDRLDAAPVLGASVDPDWLSWVPAKEVVAACALALDTDREAWNRLFDVADRVEKVDPAMAKAAPLRVRLNVLAGAMGVRPEVDLWPRLRGVSGFLAGSDAGSLDSALLAMHATDEAAAERLASDVVPRLARAFGTNPPDGPVPPGEARLLGRWNGRSLRVIRRGPTVLIGWGDSSLPGALDAHEHPEHSAGRLLRETWGERPVQRAGAVWPGRLPGLDRTSSLSKALAGSPPMVWCGGREGAEVRDEVLWTGLRETIHRLLDELPLEPPKTPTP